MHIPTTLGRLVLGAGLCAARACAPHPRSSTESALASGTTTLEKSTSVVGAATTFASSTEEHSALTVTGSETTVESSLTTLISVIETSLSSEADDTTASATMSVIETAASTTIETTTATTSVDPPIQTLEVLSNGGFENKQLEPWVVENGMHYQLKSNEAYAGSQCLQMSSPLDGPALTISQNVELAQGFEYTFSAHVKQSCTYDDGGPRPNCDDGVNKLKLSIDGVYSSTLLPIVMDLRYHEFAETFQYTGPSIDSTSLCVSIAVNQGDWFDFYIDSVSLKRGNTVPVPEEED
ncbi:hypothetical protein FGRMN_6891 [Fusarium graminum]|nr:hypothetical protein FGRMN_6891 [Fusarium graminum]